MSRILCAAVLSGALLLSGAAQAATVAVENGDFSSGGAWAEGQATAGHAGGSPTGWGASAGSNMGHWNPTAQNFVDEASHGGVGWAHAAPIRNLGNGGMLAQTIQGHTIQANTRYTLNVDVGRRLDGGAGWEGYEIGLLAGLLDGTGLLFASLTDATSGVEIPVGAFRTVSLVFETGASDPFIGKQLTLLMAGKGAGSAFDNVMLDAAPLQVSAVPEPATWAMMIVGFGAAGAMVRSSRRRSGMAFT
jgi:hypothetical protein